VQQKSYMRIVLDRAAMTTHGTDLDKVEKALTANSVKTKRDTPTDMAIPLLLEEMPDAESLMAMKIQDVGKTGQPIYLRDIARIEIVLK
jgi:multidrug efflux pump subunit AcrB